MPTDRPTALELVTAVRAHLLDNVAPLLEGQPSFHLRVATNALAIVERTMVGGAVMDQAELQRLQALLGEEGELIELNQKLAERIEADELREDREALLTHLRQTASDKLDLANPRYKTPRD